MCAIKITFLEVYNSEFIVGFFFATIPNIIPEHFYHPKKKPNAH